MDERKVIEHCDRILSAYKLADMAAYGFISLLDDSLISDTLRGVLAVNKGDYRLQLASARSLCKQRLEDMARVEES